MLYQAEDAGNPLLERVRFLAIFASNLDEFFQVRVSGLMQQVAAGHSRPTPDGLSASQKLDRIRGRVLQLQAQHSDIWDGVREELAEEGIRIIAAGRVGPSARTSCASASSTRSSRS